ncbi:hypothetical protein [Teredinibacter turnerae]|uniref:hypothetical protein n=1 Tax=Teredinibacter turnerae TaxID=2426 RepID=UPI0012BBF8F2|nr:hypothetical protein [Teredinibacter turnerae]
MEYVNRKVSWVELSSIGESKIVKSMAVWLLIVPIFSKILDPIPPQILVNILDSKFYINIALPFNTVVFYVSAVGFSLGNIFYQIACPPIIKNNKVIFSNIDNSKGISTFLYELSRMNSEHKECISRVVNEKFENSLSSEAELLFPKSANIHSGKNDETAYLLALRKTYALHACVDETKLNKKNSRILISLLYTISFLLLAYIFTQNTIVVLSQIG